MTTARTSFGPPVRKISFSKIESQGQWPRAGGGVMGIERLLVDMGYKGGLVAAVRHKAGGAARRRRSSR